MRNRILLWTAAAVAGMIVIAVLARLVTALGQHTEAADARAIAQLERDTAAGLGGFLGSDQEPPPVSDTVPRPRSDSSRSRRYGNVGPVDSLPRGATPGQRTLRQREALELLLRRGVFFRVKESNADGLRFIIARGFSLETARYRDPLIRQLYYYLNLGRPRGRPAYIEFWNFANDRKLGEYVRDTFYLGPLYATPR